MQGHTPQCTWLKDRAVNRRPLVPSASASSHQKKGVHKLCVPCAGCVMFLVCVLILSVAFLFYFVVLRLMLIFYFMICCSKFNVCFSLFLVVRLIWNNNCPQTNVSLLFCVFLVLCVAFVCPCVLCFFLITIFLQLVFCSWDCVSLCICFLFFLKSRSRDHISSPPGTARGRRRRKEAVSW